MGRYQRGYVFEAYGAFHVRYYVTELVDGKPVRVQKSERLCKKDDKYHSRTCKGVQQKAVEVMQRVNGQSGTLPEQDVLIVTFWEETYQPFLEKNVKPSTLNGYEKIWEQHLSKVFAGLTLKQYQTHMGTRFLTKLAENGLGARTIAHVKSLASGMFRHALRLNLIQSNPWRDAGSLTKPTAPEATHAYTLEEAEAISNALLDHPPSQLVFCLATFMGLRPGEIAGLRWEDIDSEWIHIRRSAWRQHIGTTKTPESVASVPLIEPVRSMVSAWRIQSGNPYEGWVFPSHRRDSPMILHGLIKRVVIPVLRQEGVAWHGLYSGRRGAATLLVQLTGNAVAAQYILRHKSLSTTTAFYIKPVRDAAVAGMRMLENKIAQRKGLALVHAEPEEIDP